MIPPNAYDASSLDDMARALAEPPAYLPPLPPGSRYAGRLGDHEGKVAGWIFEEGESGWDRGLWYGTAGDPQHPSADWHVALPADVKPMGEETIRHNGYVEELERRLADMEILRADYFARYQHQTMLAGAYKAERDALVGCLAHLRDKDWFKDANEIGSVTCLLPADATRNALSNLTP